VSGQRLFTVIKGGGMTPLEPPPPAQPAVDPNRALFDIALARRFQNSGEEL
jgi:hypothetical protein